MKNTAKGIAAAAGGFSVLALILVMFSTAPKPSRPVVENPPPGAFTMPTPASAPTAPLATEVSDGTYRVGEDLLAGEYTSRGGTDRWCYWARMKKNDGTLGDILDNNVGTGPARFTANPGEYVRIQGCTFTRVPS